MITATDLKKGDIVLYWNGTIEQECKVQWVIGDEVSLLTDTLHGGYAIVDLREEPEAIRKILVSAVPSFQSQVAHMSDEDLRLSVEQMRASRMGGRKPEVKPVKEPKIKVKKIDDNNLALLLSTMSEAEGIEFKKRMGL